MEELHLYPIGKVLKTDCSIQVSVASEYRKALTGLDGFGYVQILWWFDGCDNEKDRSTLVEDKPYCNGPDHMGVFSLRSPERPNPIALSNAYVLGIDKEHGILELAYLDADTNSPVLDIKPYTPSIDRVENPIVPAWCSHWPKSVESSGDFDWKKEFHF